MSLDAARIAARESQDLAPLIARVPYAQWLGITAVRAADIALRLQLPFAPRLVGSPVLPALHGGVVAAFMEITAQLTVLLALDEPRMPKSIDFSIDYLRSARTVPSFASGHVERLGARVAQLQVRCWQDDPTRPIALARCHFLLAEASA